MAKSTPSIFQPDAGSIQDPIYAPPADTSRLTIEQGENNAAKLNAYTKAGASIASTGIEAYKGYLEASAEKDIKSSLDRLEGFGKTAVDAQKKLDYLQSNTFAANSSLQIDQLNQQTAGFADDPTVKDFLGTIAKYKAAEQQNILSKQDVLNRVAATVKQYTAMMPGWASDFRKVAANLTGIDAADTYAVHKALTSESNAEKLALKQQELGMKYEQDVASYFGVEPGKTTPQMKLQYAQDKQLSAAADVAQKKAGLVDVDQKTTDKSWNNWIGINVTQAIGSVSNAFDKFREANGGVDLDKDPQAFAKYGAQTDALLTDIQSGLTRGIWSKTQIGPDNPRPMSVEFARQRVDDITKEINTWRTSLKDESGFNAINLMVKSAQGRYDLLLNNMMIGSPFIAQLDRTKALPPLVEKWIALNGDVEKFAAQTSPEVAKAVDAFMRGGQASASLMANAHTIPDPKVAKAAAGDSAVKVTWENTNQTLTDYAKKPTLSDNEKAYSVNTIQTYSNWLSPTDAPSMERFRDFVASGTFDKIGSQLTAQQAEAAFKPAIDNVKRSVPQLIPNMIKQATEVDANINFDGTKFSVDWKGKGAGLINGDRLALSQQVRNLNAMAGLMHQVSKYVPEAEQEGAGTITNVLRNSLVQNNIQLEKQKLELQGKSNSVQDTVQEGIDSSANIYADQINAIDKQLKFNKTFMDNIAPPEIKPTTLQGTTAAPQVKEPTNDRKSGDPDKKPAADIPKSTVEAQVTITNPDGTPKTALQKVLSLNGMINEANDVINNKESPEEARKAALADRIEAQHAILELLGDLTDEERKEYYAKRNK